MTDTRGGGSKISSAVSNALARVVMHERGLLGSVVEVARDGIVPGSNALDCSGWYACIQAYKN